MSTQVPLNIPGIFTEGLHTTFVQYHKVISKEYGILESWVDIIKQNVANIIAECTRDVREHPLHIQEMKLKFSQDITLIDKCT